MIKYTDIAIGDVLTLVDWPIVTVTDITVLYAGEFLLEGVNSKGEWHYTVVEPTEDVTFITKASESTR